MSEHVIAAAKELRKTIIFGAGWINFPPAAAEKQQVEYLAKKLDPFFSSALAKVEGEKTAAVEQSNFDRRVTENMAAHVGLAEKYAGFKTELSALRADLAAKEAAQPHEEIIALADATLAHLNPDCQAAVSIRYARDLVNLKRLASRASGNVERQK